MSETPVCPHCGIELPPDAPAGLCPKCLVAAGFESEDGSQPEVEATAASPASASFEPPSIDRLAELFPQLEILELVGKGGMGAVYKARQPGLDRLVAVKILPPEVGRDPAFAERFTREARAMARLSHPGVVAIFDFGQVRPEDPAPQAGPALFYFVMEFVDGANLRQTMQAGKLKPEEALAIVPQVCDALQYAHDEGIVHRDIKPENILLDKRGRVKIADFGLSKLMADGGGEVPEASLTGTHQVMGTLRYMAPEQMQGTKGVDHRADIYSLGVVFYELLTGDVPMGRFDPPSQKVEVDVRLDEVVLRALAQERDKRYQRASAIKTDVEIISSSQVAVGRPDSVTPATVADAIVFRRMSVFVILFWIPWAALLTALHVGYVSDAEWYFQKELPYNYLTGGVYFVAFQLVVFLSYVWYTLAKQPDRPRSMSDFIQTAQTPDRRTRRLWIPIILYLLAFAGSMVVSTAFGNDGVQATTMLVLWVASPLLVMAGCIWTYGVPKSRKSVSHGDSVLPAEGRSHEATGGVRVQRGKVAAALVVWTVLILVAGVLTLGIHESASTRRYTVEDRLVSKLIPASKAYQEIDVVARGSGTVRGHRTPDFRRNELILTLLPLEQAGHQETDSRMTIELPALGYRYETGVNKLRTQISGGTQIPSEFFTKPAGLDTAAILQWMRTAGVDVEMPGVAEEAQVLVELAARSHNTPTNEAISRGRFEIASGDLDRDYGSFGDTYLRHWSIAGGLWLLGCVLTLATRRRWAAAPQATDEPRPGEDLSGLVCAIVAVVVFVLGLLLPAVLLAVIDYWWIAGLTFLMAMVLSVVFGVLGYRYRMGRVAVFGALGMFLLAGLLAVGWTFFQVAPLPPVQTDPSSQPVPLEPQLPELPVAPENTAPHSNS